MTEDPQVRQGHLSEYRAEEMVACPCENKQEPREVSETLD
jgi:hypothetical protein